MNEQPAEWEFYIQNGEMSLNGAKTLSNDPSEGNLLLAAGLCSRAAENALKAYYLYLGGAEFQLKTTHNLGYLVGAIRQLKGSGKILSDSRLSKLTPYGVNASYAYSSNLAIPDIGEIASFISFVDSLLAEVKNKLQ